MSILQFASLTVGLALLAYVLFSYETEEKRVVDWVEAVFQKLFEHDRTISARVLGALQVLSLVVDRLLSRMYGQRIIGLHALRVAACLSLGAALTVWGGYMLLELEGDMGESLFISAAVSALIGLGFIAAAFLRTVSAVWLIIACTVAMIAAFGTVEAFFVGTIAQVVAIVDFASVAGVRTLFRMSSMARTLRGALLQVTSASAIAPVLTWAGASLMSRMWGMFGDEVAGLAIACTFVPLMTSACFAFAVFGALVVRFASALAPRVVNAFLKTKMLTNRKQLAAGSLVLIAYGSPAIGLALQKAVKVMIG